MHECLRSLLQRLRIVSASSSKASEHQHHQHEQADDLNREREHLKLSINQQASTACTETQADPHHYWPYRSTFNIYRDIVVLDHVSAEAPVLPSPQYILSSDSEPVSPLSSSSSSTLYEFPPAKAQIMSQAAAAPPPPPPPMPGTMGAMSMPDWRAHPYPVRESAPSVEQIQKQQFAHLPDKLLNTMGKERKPFTYTPQGVGEKGVLDLTEIRSPRMKKRLIANLHSGDESEEGGSSNDEASKPQQSPQSARPPPALYQQPMAPMVLPPLNAQLANRSLTPSAFHQQSQKKEVRFAASPILLSEDEELTTLLEKRRLDVESRAKIVENNPVPEVCDASTHPQQQQLPLTMNGYGGGSGAQYEHNCEQLVRNASETVQSARKMFAPPSPAVLDANNNEIGEMQAEQPAPAVNIFRQVNQVEQPTTTNLLRQHIASPTPVPVCQSPQLVAIEDETESITEFRDRVDDDLQRLRNNANQREESRPTAQGYRSVAPPLLPPASQACLEDNQPQSVKTHTNQPPTSYQPVTPPSPQQSRQEFFASLQPQPESSTLQSSQAVPQPLSSLQFRREQSAPPPPPSMAYQQVQPPSTQSRGLPSKSSEILNNLLDGLQDEINKFEQMSRETAMSSPSMGMMRSQAAQVAAKPAPLNHLNDRASCPPYQHHSDSPSSFRCISPSIELLKKTQNSQGYNYNINPKPFYRPVSQKPDQSSYQPPQYDTNNNVSYEEKTSSVQTVYPPLGPGYKHLYRPREPIRIEFEDDDESERPQSFRIADRIAAYQSQTLPRKIKLSMSKPKVDDLLLSKTYQPTDAGRHYDPETGLFSQLPEQSGDTRMFYGQSNRQTATLPNRKTAVRIHDGQDYVDSESGRTYLSNASMFSQLQPGEQPPPPQASTMTPDHLYVNPRRETSCPPPRVYTHEPGMATGGQVTPVRELSQPRLTQQQLRKLPPSQRPAEPNPAKYTGSNIPCRSFRLLQLMTGEDIENQYASQPAQPARPSSSMGAPVRSTPIDSVQRPASSLSYGRPMETSSSAFSRPSPSTMNSIYETDF